jgi:hypothetical protein
MEVDAHADSFARRNPVRPRCTVAAHDPMAEYDRGERVGPQVSGRTSQGACFSADALQITGNSTPCNSTSCNSTPGSKTSHTCRDDPNAKLRDGLTPWCRSMEMLLAVALEKRKPCAAPVPGDTLLSPPNLAEPSDGGGPRCERRSASRPPHATSKPRHVQPTSKVCR